MKTVWLSKLNLSGSGSLDNWGSPMGLDLILLHDLYVLMGVFVMSLIFASLAITCRKSGLMKYSVLSRKGFKHNNLLEFSWTVGAIMILVLVSYGSLALAYKMGFSSSSEELVAVKAIGHQWYWEYEYGMSLKKAYSKAFGCGLTAIENSSAVGSDAGEALAGVVGGATSGLLSGLLAICGFALASLSSAKAFLPCAVAGWAAISGVKKVAEKLIGWYMGDCLSPDSESLWGSTFFMWNNRSGMWSGGTGGSWGAGGSGGGDDGDKDKAKKMAEMSSAMEALWGDADSASKSGGNAPTTEAGSSSATSSTEGATGGGDPSEKRDYWADYWADVSHDDRGMNEPRNPEGYFEPESSQRSGGQGRNPEGYFVPEEGHWSGDQGRNPEGYFVPEDSSSSGSRPRSNFVPDSDLAQPANEPDPGMDPNNNSMHERNRNYRR